MLTHNTIRKYTLAVLDTFNNLKIEYPVTTNGVQGLTIKDIPIKYSSREKLNLFDEVEEKHLLSGNYNVLPRTTVALTTVVKNTERQPNKYNKIASTNFGDFTFNAVAYDFSFDMSIMCRGMNEASSIIEQITTRFNPTYTVLINEIPNQVKPTSVPIQLLDIGVETQEYDELSQDIVTVAVGLMLKGNFYSPILQIDKIKNVNMFLNLWHTSIKNEYNRAKLYDYDVNDSILDPNPTTYDLVDTEGQFGNIVPEITAIVSDDTVAIGSTISLKAVFNDYDNKIDELTFNWNVDGNTTLTSDKENAELIGTSVEVVTVQCMIIDVHSNTSNLFTKTISITQP